MSPKQPKVNTSVTLSQDAKRLLALLSEGSGISQSAVLELAIREYAEKRGVTLTRKPDEPSS